MTNRIPNPLEKLRMKIEIWKARQRIAAFKKKRQRKYPELDKK